MKVIISGTAITSINSASYGTCNYDCQTYMR